MWNQLLCEGLALGRFEQLLGKRTATEWRELTERATVEPGTLLWQGKLSFGVTICEADCCSNTASAIPVLLLKAEKRQTNIKPSYMLPVQQLLQAVLREEKEFRAEEAKALSVFVEKLESLLFVGRTR